MASIATPENEGELGQAVQILPMTALETWVRDEKSLNANGSAKPLFEAKSLPGHDHARQCELKISEEVTGKLLDLQNKGLDMNELLLEFLNKREEEIAQEKEAICENLQTATSDYVPARTKKLIRKEHGSKCSIQTCKKPSEDLHHTQTFALSRRHDPRYLAPLCKEHHTIAHSINLKAREKRMGVRG